MEHSANRVVLLALVCSGASLLSTQVAAQDKVVGGTAAPAGRYPAMAALFDARGVQQCGGTVIHPRWVLTAKHCPTIANVLVDTVTLDTGGRSIAVAQRFNHPTSDVALLRLAANAGVAVAPVHTGGMVLAQPGDAVTVSGWGATSQGGAGSNQLREANVAIIATSTCNGSTWYDGAVQNDELCAGVAAGGIDTCQGDSGGPLWQAAGGAFHLVGVTSWGWGCAQPRNPGVYVRTTHVAPWIVDTVGDYAFFRTQTGTALHQTGENFEFEVASNGDLFAIKKSGTGSGRTEVHVLTAASNYRSFSMHAVTALGPTDQTFDFVLAGNRDLFAVKKSGTGSGSTEVHVLSAASGYTRFALQTGTGLHQTDTSFEFELASNRDLFAIKKSGTGSGRTEVHVLSAASGYRSFSAHTATALGSTSGEFDFMVASNNRDLVAVKKGATGSNSTEVHVMSAASNYSQFTLQTGTPLHETGSSFSFALANNRDLVAVKKSATGTGTTELHILAN